MGCVQGLINTVGVARTSPPASAKRDTHRQEKGEQKGWSSVMACGHHSLQPQFGSTADRCLAGRPMQVGAHNVGIRIWEDSPPSGRRLLNNRFTMHLLLQPAPMCRAGEHAGAHLRGRAAEVRRAPDVPAGHAGHQEEGRLRGHRQRRRVARHLLDQSQGRAEPTAYNAGYTTAPHIAVPQRGLKLQ